MQTSNCLQCAEFSVSGWMLDKLSQSTLLSNDAVLDATALKVAAYIIRLLLVTPLLTLCSVVDLACWSLKTVTIYPVYLRGLGAHLVDLINTIAMPFFAFGMALANNLPYEKAIFQLDSDPPRSVPIVDWNNITDPNAIVKKCTLLIAAVLMYDIEKVDKLLKLKADPNLCDPAGHTPITDVARIGRDSHLDVNKKKSIEIAKLLLDNGALINKLDKFGCSALGLALMNDFQSLASLFLKRGADPLLVQGDSTIPLFKYITQKERPLYFLINQMLESVLDPNGMPDEIITAGPLKGCTKNALAVASCFYIGTGLMSHLSPKHRLGLDTASLADLWKFSEAASDFRRTNYSEVLRVTAATKGKNWLTKEQTVKLMKRVATFNETEQQFENPYMQALFVLNKYGVINSDHIKAWVPQVTRGVIGKASEELFSSFATFAPDMSKDLCALIAKYAHWESPPSTLA